MWRCWWAVMATSAGGGASSEAIDMFAQYAGHVQTVPRHAISAAMTKQRPEANISTDISQFILKVVCDVLEQRIDCHEVPMKNELRCGRALIALCAIGLSTDAIVGGQSTVGVRSVEV